MKVTVIDTCCLINLYASQQPVAIIQEVFGKVIIPKQVAKESLFIRQLRDDNHRQLVPVEINLEDLVGDATIKVVDF